MKIGKNQYIILSETQRTMFEAEGCIAFGEKCALLGESCLFSHFKNERGECLLLGYALDAEHKDADASMMLNHFLSEVKADGSNVADITLYWGGRWVLAFIIDGHFFVFQDTCGLKQAFYSNGVIASQSRYVAKAVDAQVDKSSQEYIQHAKSQDKEYSWIFSDTLYSGVQRLLPNHIYCDGAVRRVYATNRFKNLSNKERVDAVADLLRSTVATAASRSKLAVTLTAGWDSRLVLAACKDVSERIEVVTLKYNHIPDSHTDMLIPIELCMRYCHQHRKLDCKPLQEDFVVAYRSHSENAHEYWMQMTQSVQDYGYQNWLWTKGSCNEIARNSSGILYDWQVSANVLSKLYGVFPCAYSRSVLNDWLVEAKTYAKETGYSVLDLFYWEQRLGSWLAECLNEADVVGETFTPFNVRAYFELIKDVPVRYRVSPKYSFFEDVLKANGMDLHIPINPGRYDSMQSKVKCVIKNKFHLVYMCILNG